MSCLKLDYFIRNRREKKNRIKTINFDGIFVAAKLKTTINYEIHDNKRERFFSKIEMRNEMDVAVVYFLRTKNHPSADTVYSPHIHKHKLQA